MLVCLPIQAEEQMQGQQEAVAASQNEDAEAERDLEYFELVMNIFKFHVEARDWP